jgi:16S rRNA (adenine1518-N6/adenine1519-N6)-dimethyltransferase
MLTPKKSLGQNFLKSKQVASKIVAALHPSAKDVILEIGPGTGALTEVLLDSGAMIYAVEIDSRMTNFLSQKYNHASNLKVINSDIIDFDFDSIESHGRIKVIGNFPYHMTSPILEKLMDFYYKISEAVITVQKEVAARMLAPVGDSDYSSLTIFTNNFCKAKRLFDLGKDQFHPPPKVASTVVKLDFYETPIIPAGDFVIVTDLVRKLFSQRRKMVVNSLMNAMGMSRDFAERILEKSGIEKRLRPQNISLTQFARMTKELYSDDAQIL